MLFFPSKITFLPKIIIILKLTFSQQHCRHLSVGFQILYFNEPVVFPFYYNCIVFDFKKFISFWLNFKTVSSI